MTSFIFLTLILFTPEPLLKSQWYNDQVMMCNELGGASFYVNGIFVCNRQRFGQTVGTFFVSRY